MKKQKKGERNLKNPKNIIMNSKYRYIIIALIVFVGVFIIGALAIGSIGTEIEQKNVTYTEFTIADKYISENGDHYYMVVSDKNKTFDIRSDTVGADIFNQLKVGNHYHFVTQNDENGQISHIIQVYNGTN